MSNIALIKKTMQGESFFILANESIENAKNVSIKSVVLEHSLFTNLIKSINNIFTLLDRSDDFQANFSRNLWLLKSRITLTALDFNLIEIQINALIKVLDEEVSQLHGVENLYRAVRDTVNQILKQKTNPKEDAVIELLMQLKRDRKTVAILTNLRGIRTPGWNIEEDTFKGSQINGYDFTKIVSRNDIGALNFDYLIIPGNPCFTNKKLLFKCMYGGVAKNIILIYYDLERASIPKLPDFPLNHYFKKNQSITLHAKELKEFNSEELQEEPLDDWVINSFWENIRSQNATFLSNPLNEKTGLARFIIFADGRGVFLPEDGEIVEISGHILSGDNIDELSDKLPRKAIKYLEEGDIVMLRLSGSGDYLEEVAASIMLRNNDYDLKKDAVIWKELLYLTLKNHGEGVVSKTLKSLDINLKNPSYLWTWTGNEVIAPHDFEIFNKLITAIKILEPKIFLDDPAIYSEEKWKKMEKIKSYHQSAGAEIRSALIKRVKSLLNEQSNLEDVTTITLPGVSSGKMGLLRVSLVDTQPLNVPISKLFHIEKIKT